MIGKKILNTIAENLVERNETVAVAESATSGLLMSAISLATNATSFFQGGVVAYNLGQKTRHLRVDPIHAEKTNCVSDVVARQMALEVAAGFCSHWAIAITGYAAPVPELNITRCFAFYTFIHNGNVVHSERIETDETQQEKVQHIYIEHILKAFAEKTNVL